MSGGVSILRRSDFFTPFQTERGILVIDFSQLKTPEEKLLVLFLNLSGKPLTPKQIYSELNLNKEKCCVTLKKLAENSFIAKVINEYGLLYIYYKDNGGCLKDNANLGELNLKGKRKKSKKERDFGKKDSGESPETALPAANLSATAPPSADLPAATLPLVHTKLVNLPKNKSPPTPLCPDMPTIVLPLTYPENNDFDGFIYSAELPRDRYLDRMLAMIGFETIRNNSTL
jgi:hypothetical protein